MIRRLLPLVLALATACAHTPPRGPRVLVCPADGGAPWRELTSAHFWLRTDLPSGDARRVLAGYESDWAHLAQVATRYLPEGPEPSRIDLVIFARPADLQAMMHAHEYVHLQPTDDRGHPLILSAHGDASPDDVKQMLAVTLIDRRVPDAPQWLRRGLSRVLASVIERDGKLELGAPTFVIEPIAVDAIGKWLPSVVAGHDSLFGRRDLWWVASATSYAVAHWLATGTDAQQAALRQLIADLGPGVDSQHAFVTRVGEPAALAAAFAAHVQALSDKAPLPRVVVELAPSTPPPIADSERAIDEAELHYLWGLLAKPDWQLEQAEAHAPNSPLVHYWRATRTHDWLTAEAELTRAIALAPQDPRWPCALTVLRIRFALNEPDAKTLLRAMADEVARAAHVAEEPWALNELAWYYAMLNQPALGLPLARRAATATPQSWAVLDTLALLLYESGQTTQAYATEEQAFARLPDGERVSESMLDNRIRFREAARGH